MTGRPRILALAAMLMLAGCATERNAMDDLLPKVDHLIYLTPDLARGIENIETLLGVEATPGGQHPEWGTRNALVSLGEATYLEILGPDPGQPVPESGYPLGLGELQSPRLVSWAAKGSDLRQFAHEVAERGVDVGDVSSGSRRRPDGMVLSWELTSFDVSRHDGLVPFFIDWGETPHPATTSVTCCTLTALRAEHPEPERIRATLIALGIDLRVTAGARPTLVATISTPQGIVELR